MVLQLLHSVERSWPGLRISRAEHRVLYCGCRLSEYRVGVGIELHVPPLLLEPGELPPVGDSGEDFPEEESEQTDTDDTAGNT